MSTKVIKRKKTRKKKKNVQDHGGIGNDAGQAIVHTDKQQYQNQSDQRCRETFGDRVRTQRGTDNILLNDLISHFSNLTVLTDKKGT